MFDFRLNGQRDDFSEGPGRAQGLCRCVVSCTAKVGWRISTTGDVEIRIRR